MDTLIFGIAIIMAGAGILLLGVRKATSNVRGVVLTDAIASILLRALDKIISSLILIIGSIPAGVMLAGLLLAVAAVLVEHTSLGHTIHLLLINYFNMIKGFIGL